MRRGGAFFAAEAHRFVSPSDRLSPRGVHKLARRSYEQELSYRKQIAGQLQTQYVEGIHRPKYYTVTINLG